MNSFYGKICNVYNSGDDLMKAIMENNSFIYYILTQVIVQDINTYAIVKTGYGEMAADKLLTDTLLIFRRQVKFNKIVLHLRDEKVFVTKENIELFEYLNRLFALVAETSECNPSYEKDKLFEQKLINGNGFSRVYELKDAVQGTLQNMGCREQEDKEEIFDECLLVFWNKLRQGEVGVFSSVKSHKPEDYRVFNRKFFQHSKLSTYLCGIAKNIFLNKTRTSGFQISRNTSPEPTDRDDLNPASVEPDTPALFLFLFYRNMIEERKLRSVISLLQYDCNLEDKEVRELIGINNTRIHSSRLRAHFSEWYYKNIHKVSELLDVAQGYLQQRENKKEHMNVKIRAVDLYSRASLSYIDLKIFAEEFRTTSEFRQCFRIFKYIYYFTSVGKRSALAGLPDEKQMREMMDSYKAALFSLTKLQAVMHLLFYGSDEPVEAIIKLLKCLKQEMLQLEAGAEISGTHTELMNMDTPGDATALKNEIYNSNRQLFGNLSVDANFTKMICANEPV